MVRIDVEALLNDGTPNETFRKTYEVHGGKEVRISFKNGMVLPNEYYKIDNIGMNIRLTPTKPYPVKNHPDSRQRKVRGPRNRPAYISLPSDCGKGDQLFRVIKHEQTKVIWLLRIGSFCYADETSIPPEVIKVA